MKNKFLKLLVLIPMFTCVVTYAQEEKRTLSDMEKNYTQKEASEKLTPELYDVWKKNQTSTVRKNVSEKENQDLKQKDKFVKKYPTASKVIMLNNKN